MVELNLFRNLTESLKLHRVELLVLVVSVIFLGL